MTYGSRPRQLDFGLRAPNSRGRPSQGQGEAIQGPTEVERERERAVHRANHYSACSTSARSRQPSKPSSATGPSVYTGCRPTSRSWGHVRRYRRQPCPERPFFLVSMSLGRQSLRQRSSKSCLLAGGELFFLRFITEAKKAFNNGPRLRNDMAASLFPVWHDQMVVF